MAEAHAKVFEYSVELTADGELSIPGGDPLQPAEGWSADHLLLAALVRCSIDSLAYHARRAGSTARASGSASGRVTKRGSDGRYAFVEIDCRIDAAFEPPVADASELVAKAERDCFVGASLTVKPTYEWRLG
ncbi:MAG TPA: OsmC family protein [Gaiellaceae bacterium]|jgi:organic hydroperoxide reductase OsmC/OhrA